MNRSGLYIGTVIVLALAVAGYFYWMPAEPESAEPGEQEEGGFQAPAATRTPVTATRAHRGELVMQIKNATGIAEAQRLLNISPEVDGNIAEVRVREGQLVQAGDVLVRLDPSELELERDRAEEQLLTGVMNFAVTQLELPGQTSRSEAETNGRQSAREFLEGLMSARGYQAIRGQPELEERLSGLTREDLLEAQAELTSQRIALRQAELDLERTTIEAPFRGRLAGLEATSGPNARRWPVEDQRVTTSTELMILVDDDPISALPGDVFDGTVRAISPILDAESQSLAVTVTIPNPDGRIKPGMFARVRLDTEIFQDRLLVPASAVISRQQRPLVFVVHDGVAQWAYIVEGLGNDQWVEVIEGIEEGDQVITGGHVALAHDAPVTVVEELPEDEVGAQ